MVSRGTRGVLGVSRHNRKPSTIRRNGQGGGVTAGLRREPDRGILRVEGRLLRIDDVNRSLRLLPVEAGERGGNRLRRLLAGGEEVPPVRRQNGERRPGP